MIKGAHQTAWVYYDPSRDSKERTVFYSSLKERMDRLSSRTVRKWEKPRDVCDDTMGPYRNFISFRYDGSFHIRIRDNVVSQRVNRCGITVITFTGDHDAEYILSEYRKRDAVEKQFMSSKTFTGGGTGEGPRHGCTQRGDVRESHCNCHQIQDSGIHEIIRLTEKILCRKDDP